VCVTSLGWYSNSASTSSSACSRPCLTPCSSEIYSGCSNPDPLIGPAVTGRGRLCLILVGSLPPCICRFCLAISHLSCSSMASGLSHIQLINEFLRWVGGSFKSCPTARPCVLDQRLRPTASNYTVLSGFKSKSSKNQLCMSRHKSLWRLPMHRS